MTASMNDLARQVRADSLYAIWRAGSGHPGGALSASDILCELFFGAAPIGDPRDPARDRLVLSKGHGCPSYYAAAAARGWVPRADLGQLRTPESPLQGHPDVSVAPWVETSTGSLGQGFSAALGMALALRHNGRSSRVYALLGDGEMQEGQVWEVLMSGAHFRLDNLTAILDDNKLQSDDRNANIMGLEPLVERLSSFGWFVQSVDGHDADALRVALQAARGEKERPSFVVAHTIKGKGVSFMEDVPAWHGSVKLSHADFIKSLESLGLSNEEVEAYRHGKLD